MSFPQPKDAAAVILLRPNTDPSNPEVFWVKRSTKLAFLGGYRAFPGGQRETLDEEIKVRNCDDQERSAMISCGARELFEEVGVLLARGAEALTVGQRASLFDDLESGRMTWPQLLSHYGLQLDADDFTFAGRWVTPPFAPRRFDTWFFLGHCPTKQEPRVTGDAELESGEWANARDVYAQWLRSELIVVPPVLHGMKTLASGLGDDLVERFLSVPEAHRQVTRRMEFHPNYICFPLRTPTKPPATHTNCYLIYSSREVIVVDPGSPYEDEQAALAECLDDLIGGGRTPREILLTHVHPDHIAGVNALRTHLKEVHHQSVPVAAHRLTAESSKGQFPVDRFIADNEVISLAGEPAIALRALYTPGHARGHLCFYDESSGALLSGDNVVGFGSVLIDPADGNMRDYLASLERMRALPKLSVLFCGHGPPVANAHEKIDGYINHRLERERSILNAVREGASTPKEIVARVYTDVSPKAHAMAERAVQAHLDKLIEDGVVERGDGGGYKPCQNRER
ncbi:MAG TPA: MBL fold metallo-hydrolase [Pyrinomonadaceae bacterium]|jgi:glyoxylase-like metal-dependent hydrolase (beta-lactamase superfamily II)/8-oxo-dGTP pyrophosphatase MutT (NUDIX family)|nr:MBL fold metallo-hydrolase [Pyrinomonadaceae bacterium]